MRFFGLIGHPVTHSFSKDYFEAKFSREGLTDCSYQLFDLPNVQEIFQLKTLTPELSGLNVTIPYKQSIIPFLDGLSEKAKSIGAVNTIKIESGKWVGHNSDVHGFYHSILPLLRSTSNSALILGTGGSSRAVKFALDELSIPSLFVSRQAKHNCISYNSLNQSVFADYNIIINTTPSGMFPRIDERPPIPFEFVNSDHIFYDLIYNPTMTLLLKTAKEKGCTIKNGLDMLHLQAEKSWEIWTNPGEL